MMGLDLRAPALAFVLVALMLPTQAQGCTTSEPTISLDMPQGQAYLVLAVAGAPSPVSADGACRDHACTAGAWLYLESNHVTGLQRDDRGRDDTGDSLCYPPDQMVA